MKYKKSPLDCFLQQRISDNAKELKNTLNETLQEEQDCLELIHGCIMHCKQNIANCEERINKCSLAARSIYETKKLAFKDNLTIWNMLGHIQMASIEMKECLKRLSVNDIDEWEQRDVIKSAYTAILTDNIITIYTEVGSKNPALMVETDSLITEVKFEYMPLLNYDTENNFEKGFRKYLMADPIVNLQEDDYDSALTYIRQHMESGVGLWTEDAVILQLKNWKLSLNSTPSIPNSDTDIEVPTTRVAESPITTDANKHIKAKARIQSIVTIDEAKQLLEALCDLGYDKILDIILK